MPTMSIDLILHPELGEWHEEVVVHHPSTSSPYDAWLDRHQVATLSMTHPGPTPAVLLGVPFKREVIANQAWRTWAFPPQNATWHEPPLPSTPKRWTSGLVVIESDARIWLVHPTNRFGDIEATFPKGRLEPDLSLVVNAIKETWEESGLVAHPVAWLADIERERVYTRYYVARRIGGDPLYAGWESQAVSLVPACQLPAYVNRPNDRKLFPAIDHWLQQQGLNLNT